MVEPAMRTSTDGRVHARVHEASLAAIPDRTNTVQDGRPAASTAVRPAQRHPFLNRVTRKPDSSPEVPHVEFRSISWLIDLIGLIKFPLSLCLILRSNEMQGASSV